MKKHYICIFILILSVHIARSQTAALRGMYIDDFDAIIGNPVKEDSLLQYAQDSSYNYLALYDLHSINLQNVNTANTVASFIKRARDVYGITYVGAVGETYSSFQNRIAPYNNNRSDDHEKFNVFNLEFEFWIASSVNPGGYYCTQYLQQANCSCDTSGAFQFFIRQLHLIDSLAAVQNVLSETYLGWFNQGQGSQIQQNVDRILLHAYRTNTSSLFGYSKNRLQYLASNNVTVDVAPIFSAEPNFMGPWLDSHAQIEAFTKYQTDFDNDQSAWKQYINIIGYQWFDWGYMPKPVSGSFSPVITASGNSTTVCLGDSLVLTATAGDSYNWSNGATTRSISVFNAGSFTCDVTLNGNTSTTPVVMISESNKPSAYITQGSSLTGSVPLMANAAAGSGTISAYQWQRNSGSISGANSYSYNATVSGDYTVMVTNSNGCSMVSAPETVVVPGSCIASTPSGLSSAAAGNLSELVSWAPGQSGDSIVIRYHPDTASTYSYITIPNNGQNSYLLTDLEPWTTYSWRVKMLCGGTSGTYSAKSYFTTAGPLEVQETPGGTAFRLFPNPAKSNVQVEFVSNSNSTSEIVFTDLSGRIVSRQQVLMKQGLNSIFLYLDKFQNGIYTVAIKNDEELTVKKLVIEH